MEGLKTADFIFLFFEFSPKISTCGATGQSNYELQKSAQDQKSTCGSDKIKKIGKTPLGWVVTLWRVAVWGIWKSFRCIIFGNKSNLHRQEIWQVLSFCQNCDLLPQVAFHPTCDNLKDLVAGWIVVKNK